MTTTMTKAYIGYMRRHEKHAGIRGEELARPFRLYGETLWKPANISLRRTAGSPGEHETAGYIALNIKCLPVLQQETE